MGFSGVWYLLPKVCWRGFGEREKGLQGPAGQQVGEGVLWALMAAGGR